MSLRASHAPPPGVVEMEADLKLLADAAIRTLYRWMAAWCRERMYVVTEGAKSGGSTGGLVA